MSPKRQQNIAKPLPLLPYLVLLWGCLLATAPSWAGVSPTSGWPTFGGDVTHQGQGKYQAPFPADQDWDAALGAALYATPAMAPNDAYLIQGTDDGRLLWLDPATGAVTTTVTALGQTGFRATPLVSAENAGEYYVYAANMDGRLYCQRVNVATAAVTQSWNVPQSGTWGPLVSSPFFVTVGGVEYVAVASLDGRLYLVDPADPAAAPIAWYNAGGAIESTPALGAAKPVVTTQLTQALTLSQRSLYVQDVAGLYPGDGLQFAGETVSCYITRVDPAAKRIDFRVNGSLDTDHALGENVTNIPHAPLFICTNSGRIHAINGDELNPLRRWLYPDEINQAQSFLGSPLLKDDFLYVGDRGGTLYTFDAYQGTPQAYTTATVQTLRHSALAGALTTPAFTHDAGTNKDYLMIGTQANGLVAINITARANPVFSHAYTLSGAVRVQPVIDTTEHVLVGTTTGVVYALENETNTVLWAWPHATADTLAARPRNVPVGASTILCGDRAMLVVTADGHVIRLHEGAEKTPPAAGTVPAGPWAQYQRGGTHQGKAGEVAEQFTAPKLPAGANPAFNGNRVRWTRKTEGSVHATAAVTRNDDTVRKTTLAATIPAVPTGSTGSTVITVADVTSLYVGDLIAIGTDFLGPITAIDRATRQITVTTPTSSGHAVGEEVVVSRYRQDKVRAGESRYYGDTARTVAGGSESGSLWYNNTAGYLASTAVYTLYGRIKPRFSDDIGMPLTKFRATFGGQEIRFGYQEDDAAIKNPANLSSPIYAYVFLRDDGTLGVRRYAVAGGETDPHGAAGEITLPQATEIVNGIDVMMTIRWYGVVAGKSYYRATAWYRLPDAAGQFADDFTGYLLIGYYDLPTYDTITDAPNPDYVDNAMPTKAYPFTRGYDLNAERPGYDYSVQDIRVYFGYNPITDTYVLGPNTRTFYVDHAERFLPGDRVELINGAQHGEITLAGVDKDRLSIAAGSTINGNYPAGTIVRVGQPGKWAAYAGSDDGNLRAINPEDGTLYWMNSVDQYLGAIQGAPVIDNARGRVYVASASGRLFAFAQNGQFLWAYPTLQDPGFSPFTGAPAIDAAGNIYVGTEAGYVYKITPDGTLAMQTADPTEYCLFDAHSPITGGVALYQLDEADPDTMRVVVASREGKLVSLDQDLTQVWAYDTGTLTAAPVVGPDGTIYIGDEAGKVHAVYENGGAVQTRWATPFTTETSVRATAAVVNVVVYVADTLDTADPARGKRVYAIDSDGNAVGKSAQMDGQVLAPLTVDASGNVLAATWQGSVYCFTPITADDQAAAWQWNTRTDANMPIALPIRTAPTLWMGTIALVGGYDGNIYAIGVANNTAPSISKTIVQPSSVWPFAHRDGRRQGSTAQMSAPEPGPRQPSLRWFRQHRAEDGSPSALRSTPVVTDRTPGGLTRVYIGTDDGVLHAYDASTGAPIATGNWGVDIDHIGMLRLASQGPIRATPAVHSDGSIAMGVMDGRTYAVRADGSLKWQTGLLGCFASSPVTGKDGTVFAATADSLYTGGNFVLQGGALPSPAPPDEKTVLTDGDNATEIVGDSTMVITYELPAAMLVSRIRIRTQNYGQLWYEQNGEWKLFGGYPETADPRYIHIELNRMVTGLRWRNLDSTAPWAVSAFEVYTAEGAALAPTMTATPAVVGPPWNFVTQVEADLGASAVYVQQATLTVDTAGTVSYVDADGTTHALRDITDPGTYHILVGRFVTKVLWQSAVNSHVTEFTLSGGGGGRLYGLNEATGAIAWQYPAAAQPALAPVIAPLVATMGNTAVSPDIVYVATTGGTLAAVNGSTGVEIWTRALGARVSASPVLVEGPGSALCLLVPDEEGYVHLVNAADGTLHWSVELEGPFVSAAATTAGRKAFLINATGRVYRFEDLRAGSTSVVLGTLTTRMKSSPVIDSLGRVFFGSDSGDLYCMDPSSGSILWTYRPDRSVISTTLYRDIAIDTYRLPVTFVEGFKVGDTVQIIRPDGTLPENLGQVVSITGPQQQPTVLGVAGMATNAGDSPVLTFTTLPAGIEVGQACYQADNPDVRYTVNAIDTTAKTVTLASNIPAVNAVEVSWIFTPFMQDGKRILPVASTAGISIDDDVSIQAWYDQQTGVPQPVRLLGKVTSIDAVNNRLTLDRDIDLQDLDNDGTADLYPAGSPVFIGAGYGIIEVSTPTKYVRAGGDIIRVQRSIAWPMRTSPAIGPGQVVYIGADDGILYAIGPTGPAGYPGQLPWLPGQATASTWWTFHHDNQRTGFAERPSAYSPELRWWEDTGSTLETSPAMGMSDADAPLGVLYIGTGDETDDDGIIRQRGALISMNASNGNLRWRFNENETLGRVMTSPAVFVRERKDEYDQDVKDEQILFGTQDLPEDITASLTGVIIRDAQGNEATVPVITVGDTVVALLVNTTGGFKHGMEVFLTDANSAVNMEICGTIGSVIGGGRLQLREPFIATQAHATGSWVRAQTSQQGHLYCVDRGGKLRWKFPRADAPASEQIGPVRSAPVVDCRQEYDEKGNIYLATGGDGTVYFGTDDGIVYAVDMDGELKWSFVVPRNGAVDTSLQIVASPTLSKDGKLLFVSVSVPDSNRGYLLALNTTTTDDDQRLVWTRQLAGPVTASPMLTTVEKVDRLFVGVDDYDNTDGLTGRFYCINPDTGAVVDIYGDDAGETIGPIYGTAAAVPETSTTIYRGIALGADGVTIAMATTEGLDKGMRVKIIASGAVEERTIALCTPTNITLATPIDPTKFKGDVSLQTNDQVVLVGSLDGNLYAFTEKLVLLWSFSTGGPIRTSPAIGVENGTAGTGLRSYVAYFGSNNHYLYALSFYGDQYRLAWERNMRDRVYGSPIIGMRTWDQGRAVLYQAGRNQIMYAFGDWIGYDEEPPSEVIPKEDNPPIPPDNPEAMVPSDVDINKAVEYSEIDPETGNPDTSNGWWKFIITVRNTGRGVVDKVKVTDTLPPSLCAPYNAGLDKPKPMALNLKPDESVTITNRGTEAKPKWEVVWTNKDPVTGVVGEGFRIKADMKDPTQVREEYLRTFYLYVKVADGRPDAELVMAKLTADAAASQSLSLDDAAPLKRGMKVLIDNPTMPDEEVEIYSVNETANTITVSRAISAQSGALVRMATKLRVTTNQQVMYTGDQNIAKTSKEATVRLGDPFFLQVLNHPTPKDMGGTAGHNQLFAQGETYNGDVTKVVPVVRRKTTPVQNDWTDTFVVRLYYNGNAGERTWQNRAGVKELRLASEGNAVRVFSPANQINPDSGEPLVFKWSQGQFRANGVPGAWGRRMQSFPSPNKEDGWATSGVQFLLYPQMRKFETIYSGLGAGGATLATTSTPLWLTPYAWRVTIQQGKTQMNQRVVKWGPEVDFTERIALATVTGGTDSAGNSTFPLYVGAGTKFTLTVNDAALIKAGHHVVIDNPSNDDGEAVITEVAGNTITLKSQYDVTVEANAVLRDEWSPDLVISNPIAMHTGRSNAELKLGGMVTPGHTATSPTITLTNSSAWGQPATFAQYRFRIQPIDLRHPTPANKNWNDDLADADYEFGRLPVAGADWDGFRYDPYAEKHMAISGEALDLPEGLGLRPGQQLQLHMTRRVPSHQDATDYSSFVETLNLVNLRYEDLNCDGAWQRNERLYFDLNANGHYDANDASLATGLFDTRIFLDMNGNRIWDAGEPYYQYVQGTPDYGSFLSTSMPTLPNTSLAVAGQPGVEVPTTVVDMGRHATASSYSLPQGHPVMENPGNTALTGGAVTGSAALPNSDGTNGFDVKKDGILVRTGSSGVTVNGTEVVWRELGELQPLFYTHTIPATWKLLKSPAGAERNFGRPFELPIPAMDYRQPTGTYTGTATITSSGGTGSVLLNVRVGERRLSQVESGLSAPPSFDIARSEAILPTTPWVKNYWTQYLTGVESWPAASTLPGFETGRDLAVFVASNTPVITGPLADTELVKLLPTPQTDTNIWYRRVKQVTSSLNGISAATNSIQIDPALIANGLVRAAATTATNDLIILRKKPTAGETTPTVWYGQADVVTDAAGGWVRVRPNLVWSDALEDTIVEIQAHPWVPLTDPATVDLTTGLAIRKVLRDPEDNADPGPQPIYFTTPSLTVEKDGAGSRYWLLYAVSGVRKITRNAQEHHIPVSYLAYKPFNPDDPRGGTMQWIGIPDRPTKQWTKVGTPKPATPGEITPPAPLPVRTKPALVTNLNGLGAVVLYEGGGEGMRGLHYAVTGKPLATTTSDDWWVDLPLNAISWSLGESSRPQVWTDSKDGGVDPAATRVNMIFQGKNAEGNLDLYYARLKVDAGANPPLSLEPLILPEFGVDQSTGVVTETLTPDTEKLLFTGSTFLAWWPFYDKNGADANRLRLEMTTSTTGTQAVTLKDWNGITATTPTGPVGDTVREYILECYHSEPFTDTNGNGKRDDGETYTDANGNGRFEGGIFRLALDPYRGIVRVLRKPDSITITGMTLTGVPRLQRLTANTAPDMNPTVSVERWRFVGAGAPDYGPGETLKASPRIWLYWARQHEDGLGVRAYYTAFRMRFAGDATNPRARLNVESRDQWVVAGVTADATNAATLSVDTTAELAADLMVSIENPTKPTVFTRVASVGANTVTLADPVTVEKGALIKVQPSIDMAEKMLPMEVLAADGSLFVTRQSSTADVAGEAGLWVLSTASRDLWPPYPQVTGTPTPHDLFLQVLNVPVPE